MNGGIDRVELVEFGTLCEAKFATMEVHNWFWRQVVMEKNREYLISLAWKRVTSFAATRGREDEAHPFVVSSLLPTKVLKPLLVVDEQERQPKEILQHKEWREKKMR